MNTLRKMFSAGRWRKCINYQPSRLPYSVIYMDDDGENDARSFGGQSQTCVTNESWRGCLRVAMPREGRRALEYEYEMLRWSQ